MRDDIKVITSPDGELLRQYAKKFWPSEEVSLFPEGWKSPQEMYVWQPPETVHTIITFSPFIISMFPPSKIQILGKGFTFTQPDFNTYGASVNKIVFCLFNQTDTIHSNPAKELRRLAESTGDMEVITNKIQYEFGESVEKMMKLHSLYTRSKNEA